MSYALTKSRVLQWIGIILILCVFGGAYWYFQVFAGVKTNTSLTDPLSEGLAGYWKMDDGSGTSATDSSTNGNTGTLTNGPTWTTGQIGGAVDLDGDNDVIVVGDPSSGVLDFDSNDFSVAFWMNGAGYSNQGASTNAAVSKRNDSNGVAAGYSFTYPSSNTMSFSMANGTTLYSATHTIATTSDNQWHYYVGVRSGSAIYLYVDGAQVASASGVSGSVSSTTGLQIGDGGTANTRNSNALFDEVRIYNRALSSDEVSQLYRLSTPTGTDTSLKGYWSFNGKDISGTTAYDRSGAGNNGTLTNGPAVTQGKVGQALSFDGSNDYVATTDYSFSNSQSFTMSVWFNANNVSSEQSILTKATYEYNFRTNGSTLFYSYWDTGASDEIGFSYSGLIAKQWYLATVTYDGSGTAYLYVNGNRVASDTNVVDPFQNRSDVLQIGGGYHVSGNQRYFNGLIDEVRIYNRALSENEIQSLYKQGQSDELNTSASQPQGTGRLDSGLAGYWKLDEGTGTSAADSSTNGNTGTFTGTPTWTTGRVGGAVSFTSVSGSGIDVGDPASGVLDFGTGDFTISTWALSTGYVLQSSTYNVIISKHDTSGGNWGLTIDSTNKVYFQCAGATGAPSSASAINDSQWHHIVGTRVAGVATLYVDGALQSGTQSCSGSASNAFNFKIGDSDFGGRKFNGSLDEVRIYNRALSADEVSQLYRVSSPTGTDTSLKGYWSFNGKDISGTTAYDRSGAGNNGTLTNGPTVTPGKVGQALNFTRASTQYITIPSTTSLQSSIFTYAAWVNPTTYTIEGNIFGTNAAGPRFSVEVGGALKLTQTGVAVIATTTATIPTSAWSHVAVTYDASGNYIFYINGVNVYSGTNLKSFTWSGFNIANTSSNVFDGKIDEVRIYNTALTAAQIQALYSQGQSDEVNTGASQAQGTGRLDSGLAGYWKLDEGSGTSATDSSTNGNTGTLTGGPTWTTGQIGGAVDFDATDDYIDLGNPSALNIAGPITVSAWVKFSTSQDNRVIAGRWGTDQSYILLIDAVSSNKLAFCIRVSDVNKCATSSATYVDGAWHHAVGRFNGANVLLTMDGGKERIVGDATAGPIDTPSQNVRIGRYNDGSSGFLGSLDEIRIYSRALADDEVSQLYRLSAPSGTDTGLKGYWSFNGKDISGTTAYDRSGAGNNGTLTNGPTVTPGKVGQALSFDGTDDYVTGNITNVPMGNTMVMWFKANDVTGNKVLFSHDDNTNNGQRLSLLGSALKFTLGSVNDYSCGLSAVEANTWYFLAVTNTGNGGTATCYLGQSNGALVTGSPVAIGTRTGTPTKFNIGRLPVAGVPFGGAIDEVRIYNRALTAAEITALYNSSR